MINIYSKDKETKGDSGVWLRIKRYLEVANGTVAILPIPQVLFLIIIFSKMRGPKSLNTRKVLSAVVLVQYLPRALRVYLSWTEVIIHRNIMIKPSKSIIAVKAGFNLFLFIIASHFFRFKPSNKSAFLGERLRSFNFHLWLGSVYVLPWTFADVYAVGGI
ncbi:cyclic nucleotide-gated ion channel 1-like [Juglans microcarpa x Juglans regia]|uniref:cyclic nucleotide-gated ion channel 1-like n=1 Tax=Juglans microcarpa x Juglans regia TaxID=2249226 RepID=UPI001B7EEBA9|nr:cyclic nucleotide-gated ion channel 1-like [Juglans microcarpa x Juglans regia]